MSLFGFGTSGLAREQAQKNEKERYAEIDRNLAAYRDRKLLEIDRDIFNRQQQALRTYFEQKEKTVDQRLVDGAKIYEAQTKMGVELAETMVKIELGRDVLKRAEGYDTAKAAEAAATAKAEAAEKVIAAKDATIALLDGLVKVVTGKLPKVELEKLGLNVTVTGESKK